MFIESWCASRGSRQGRLHSFMCNASVARSPDTASGCRALRKSATQQRLCRDSTRQRVASRPRQENRAVVHTKLGNSHPGVAVLGDPGRVGEKDLQVGLHGLGEHGVHGVARLDRSPLLRRPGMACAESTHRAGTGPHRIGSSPRGLIEKPSPHAIGAVGTGAPEHIAICVAVLALRTCRGTHFGAVDFS